MRHWTLGFVFTAGYSTVLLIHKEHPIHQKGKWNGLGGKVEINETAQECICREVFEESNLSIPSDRWTPVGKLFGHDHSEEEHHQPWTMDVFAALYDGNIHDLQTMTDERVQFFPVSQLPAYTKENLYWLIPLSIDRLKNQDIVQFEAQYSH